MMPSVDFMLAPGSVVTTSAEVMIPEPGCVVTITQRVANHGWHDRDKITYYGP